MSHIHSTINDAMCIIHLPIIYSFFHKHGSLNFVSVIRSDMSGDH